MGGPADQARPHIVGFDTDEASPSASAPRLESARSATTVEPPASEKQADAEYTVWYATNRKPRDPFDSQKGYGAEPDTSTHYGSCRVFIPHSHKIGSTGSSWWRRLVSFSDDRLKLLLTVEAPSDDYWRDLAEHVSRIRVSDRHAVVFIHGYNVSFDEAALRAAQIGFDLQVRGAMAFFSWPSRDSLANYPADEEAIALSEHAISDYLVDFARNSGASAVHVIAHSMGNRGLLRAINRIAADAQHRTSIRFRNFILAAADIDVAMFRRDCAAYRALAAENGRTTLYVSSKDLAMEASAVFHGGTHRVGRVPPVTVIKEIDTINVTDVDLSALGHGYVAEVRDVLHDIHSLIFTGAAPGDRMGLVAQDDAEGNRYWKIGK